MPTIIRKRGETKPILITLKYADTGLPVNLTGYTFELVVDPDPAPQNSDGNLFRLTGMIVDAANGEVSFTPTEPQADQVPQTYYHQLQYLDASNTSHYFDIEPFIIQPRL